MIPTRTGVILQMGRVARWSAALGLLGALSAPVVLAGGSLPSGHIINPAPAYQDLFGINVQWAGDVVAVGAMQDEAGGVARAGAVHLFDGSSTTGYLGPALVKLSSPLPVSGSEFGGSIAATGGVVVVGSSWAGYNWFRPGAAYVYDADPASAQFGSLLTSLPNPRPNLGDEFGFSVVPVGNNVLVGAYREGALAPSAGAAYLFDVDRASANFGTLIATFENPTPQAKDYFGVAATSLNGGRLAVGAFRDDTAGPDAGAVYLFDAQPGGANFGAPLHTFVNPRPSPTGANGQNDEFGHVLAADGDYLFVSAFREDTGATDAGAVYMFDANPQSPSFGTLVATFEAPDPAAGSNFGFALALVGHELLVGCWMQPSASQPKVGAVYRFDADPQSPTFTSFLEAFSSPVALSYQLFGAALGVGPRGLLVGAPGAGLVGGVYVYGSP